MVMIKNRITLLKKKKKPPCFSQSNHKSGLMVIIENRITLSKKKKVTLLQSQHQEVVWELSASGNPAPRPSPEERRCPEHSIFFYFFYFFLGQRGVFNISPSIEHMDWNSPEERCPEFLIWLGIVCVWGEGSKSGRQKWVFAEKGDFYWLKTGLLRQKEDLRLWPVIHPCYVKDFFLRKNSLWGTVSWRQLQYAINCFEILTWVGEQWEVEEE